MFVKNIAMHELGHALGLGHASSQMTSDAPELMYYTSSPDTLLYPSTLDLYGLDMLYQDNFGDEVVLLGEQGGESISADDLAERAGTINYEILTAVSPRVPRLYLNS